MQARNEKKNTPAPTLAMFILYRMAFGATKGYPEWNERCLTLTVPLEAYAEEGPPGTFRKEQWGFHSKVFFYANPRHR